MRRSNPWLGPPEFLAGNVFMEGTDMSKKKDTVLVWIVTRG